MSHIPYWLGHRPGASAIGPDGLGPLVPGGGGANAFRRARAPESAVGGWSSGRAHALQTGRTPASESRGWDAAGGHRVLTATARILRG